MGLLYKLSMKAGEEEYDFLAGLLARKAAYGWEEIPQPENGTVFEIYSNDRDFLFILGRDAVEMGGISEPIISSQEEKNWQEAWKVFFTPIKCGTSFTVIPPWLKDGRYDTQHKIIIEPECAFGTGHHASTVLCLEALDALFHSGFKGDNFLDLGCGSGILGIGASLEGMKGLGVDIDPVAINNARKNRVLNKAESLELAEGSIDKVGEEKFDLVMANILAGPLIELAPRICGILSPYGKIILSGILYYQADDVEKAFRKNGMNESERIYKDEWCCLVLSRS